MRMRRTFAYLVFAACVVFFVVKNRAAEVHDSGSVGSGDWKIWVKGQTDEQYIGSPAYCASGKHDSDECALRVVEQPENVWWVQIRDALGREGWTREVDHFGNIDSCG